MASVATDHGGSIMSERFTKENFQGSDADRNRLNAQFDAESKGLSADEQNAVANRLRDEHQRQERLNVQPNPNAPTTGPQPGGPSAGGIPRNPDADNQRSGQGR
jgi:hypothetical protein